MARMAKWQRTQEAAAVRTFVWGCFSRRRKHNLVKIRRAYHIMGYKESAPVRKRR